MNSTIIALMLVSSQGASEVAQFQDMESCMAAKAQIVENDSFCYKRGPMDHKAALDQMSEVLSQMAQSLKAAMKEMKDEQQ